MLSLNMVTGRILGLVGLGLVGAYLLNSLVRPAEAIQSGAALTATGQGIGGIGAGIGDALRSIGSGSAKLLDPLWSLKSLIYDTHNDIGVLYDSNVSGSANTSPVAQISGETNQGVNKPSSSTITWSSGTTATVPTLSPAAQAYYKNIGVSVT